MPKVDIKTPIITAQNNSISLDTSSFNYSKDKEKVFSPKDNKPKKVQETIEEKDESFDMNNIEIKKIFECLSFIYDNQEKLQEKQNQMEKKLDQILDLLKKNTRD